ncbi:hypothetical protein R3P38DRAFT_3359060 [Favolaschia claudopus]|uniref:Uncharacterized protein n=1 Tax=Favolaschia claudopus TaxID=2862362 RepID=A0AAW0B311_9AGAR
MPAYVALTPAPHLNLAVFANSPSNEFFSSSLSLSPKFIPTPFIDTNQPRQAGAAGKEGTCRHDARIISVVKGLGQRVSLPGDEWRMSDKYPRTPHAQQDEKQRDDPNKETSRLEAGARQPYLGEGALELECAARQPANIHSTMLKQTSKSPLIRISASRREEKRRNAEKGKLKDVSAPGPTAQRNHQIAEMERNPPDDLEHEKELVFSSPPNKGSRFSTLFFPEITTLAKYGPHRRRQSQRVQHTIRCGCRVGRLMFSRLPISSMAHDMYASFDTPGGALLFVRSQFTDVQRFSVAC